jgi:hypothetical protein
MEPVNTFHVGICIAILYAGELGQYEVNWTGAQVNEQHGMTRSTWGLTLFLLGAT